MKRHHDASFGAMTQVAVAPCSPFSVSTELLREGAELARRLGVRLPEDSLFAGLPPEA